STRGRRPRPGEGDVAAAPCGRALARLSKAVVACDNRHLAAMVACDPRLLIAAPRADDARAQIFRPWAEQHPAAARRSVDQHGLAGFELMGSVQEIFRG